MKWKLPFLLLLAPPPAFAHAMLEHAYPSAGAVTRGPGEIRLEFSEELEPAFSGVMVTDSSGHSAGAAMPEISGTTMVIKLRALSPGEYRVEWHAVSVDTHRTEGSYSFTVSR